MVTYDWYNLIDVEESSDNIVPFEIQIFGARGPGHSRPAIVCEPNIIQPIEPIIEKFPIDDKEVARKLVVNYLKNVRLASFIDDEEEIMMWRYPPLLNFKTFIKEFMNERIPKSKSCRYLASHVLKRKVPPKSCYEKGECAQLWPDFYWKFVNEYKGKRCYTPIHMKPYSEFLKVMEYNVPSEENEIERKNITYEEYREYFDSYACIYNTLVTLGPFLLPIMVNPPYVCAPKMIYKYQTVTGSEIFEIIMKTNSENQENFVSISPPVNSLVYRKPSTIVLNFCQSNPCGIPATIKWLQYVIKCNIVDAIDLQKKIDELHPNLHPDSISEIERMMKRIFSGENIYEVMKETGPIYFESFFEHIAMKRKNLRVGQFDYLDKLYVFESAFDVFLELVLHFGMDFLLKSEQMAYSYVRWLWFVANEGNYDEEPNENIYISALLDIDKQLKEKVDIFKIWKTVPSYESWMSLLVK